MRTRIRIPGLLLTLLATSLLQFPVSGQNSYKGKIPTTQNFGYIITLDGDTLYGTIITRGSTKDFLSTVKYSRADRAQQHFTADQLKGMGIRLEVTPDPESGWPYLFWDHYVPKELPATGNKVFLNRLTSGRITVYQDARARIIKSEPHCGKANGFGFEFGNSGEEEEEDDGIPVYLTRSTEMEGLCAYTGYYAEKEGLALVHVNKKVLDLYWFDIFGDCPKMQEELNTNPELRSFKKFIKAVQAYNRACSPEGAIP